MSTDTPYEACSGILLGVLDNGDIPNFLDEFLWVRSGRGETRGMALAGDAGATAGAGAGSRLVVADLAHAEGPAVHHRRTGGCGAIGGAGGVGASVRRGAFSEGREGSHGGGGWEGLGTGDEDTFRSGGLVSAAALGRGDACELGGGYLGGV